MGGRPQAAVHHVAEARAVLERGVPRPQLGDVVVDRRGPRRPAHPNLSRRSHRSAPRHGATPPARPGRAPTARRRADDEASQRRRTVGDAVEIVIRTGEGKAVRTHDNPDRPRSTNTSGPPAHPRVVLRELRPRWRHTCHSTSPSWSSRPPCSLRPGARGTRQHRTTDSARPTSTGRADVRCPTTPSPPTADAAPAHTAHTATRQSAP
jgi:hypothetical protein